VPAKKQKTQHGKVRGTGCTAKKGKNQGKKKDTGARSALPLSFVFLGGGLGLIGTDIISQLSHTLHIDIINDQ
jgi:hypothetical protein